MKAHAEGFPRFERRGGGFGQGNRVLLDSGQRFAKPGPEFTGYVTEGIQDILPTSGLRLLVIEHIAGTAAPGTQPQHIFAAQFCDGAFQHGSAPGPLTDFAGRLESQPFIGPPFHQVKGVLDSPFGDEA